MGWAAAWPRSRRALSRGRHSARRLAEQYARDDHDMAPAIGQAGAPGPPGDLDLAGWQAQFLIDITEHLYSPRAQLNGHTLASWLREDSPGAADGQLAVVLMTLYAFIRDLARNTDQANGQYAMARAVVLGAFEDACQCAVLDLTAVARSGA